MEIREINNKEIWEGFLSEGKEKTFLNSWNWGEFQQALGNKLWRLGIYDNDLIGVAIITKVSAKRGTFLFLSHGPNLKAGIDKKEVLQSLLAYLNTVAEKENASFLRVSSLWEYNEENRNIFKDLNFRDAPIHINPDLTWKLNISLPEEQLLAGMRKTTRYLIKQAQKNPEVEIVQSRDLKDVAEFNKIYQTTVSRHNFTPFPLSYLEKEFKAFDAENQISIFLGKYKGEIISSAMVIFWQGNGFYHQGASSQKYPKIPVSYLLQWEAIKEAKNRGCLTYNFWGIAPIIKDKKIKVRDTKHPWAGLTLFKTGFGGYEEEYIKTQDFVFSNKYWLNWAVEKIRNYKRGF
ncbi:peptidoglycan bridge formation glycyltransferase FemA/FemB family protein [Candidatus Parcubacteria bacterium]|nr:peptidoglycan bridge formation glycyltransferase FemA/FemB family protein [Candidatus Parcubacteria bacterium]